MFSVLCETFTVLENYFKKGGSSIKFDLTTGYHNIDTFDDYKEFLGFSWNFEEKVKHFKFIVFPFRL